MLDTYIKDHSPDFCTPAFESSNRTWTGGRWSWDISDLQIGEFSRDGRYYPIRTRVSGGCQEEILGSGIGPKVYYEQQADFQVVPDDFGGWRVSALHHTTAPLVEIRVRVILINSYGTRGLSEAFEIAQSARDRIEGGMPFAEVAKEVSEDPVSAARGGDLGFFKRGEIDPAFEDKAFGASLGEVVGPISSPSGVALLEVTERRPIEDP